MIIARDEANARVWWRINCAASPVMKSAHGVTTIGQS